jgi:hypothetical protein
MNQLLASGGIFAVILLLMIVEACVLIPYYRRTGLGVAPAALLLTLASGGSLLLAIGAVLLKAPLVCIGLCLCLALVAHVADLGQRWQNAARKNPAASGLTENELNDAQPLQSHHGAPAASVAATHAIRYVSQLVTPE